jgi:hypothetical protein
MHLDARAARIARRQYGLLAKGQALALGYTSRAIRTKLSNGTWVEIRRGVYVINGSPPCFEQTLLAVTLPLGDCWVAHGTAARHWEMRYAPQVDAIEVLRPYGRSRRLDGVVSHRSRIIVPADVTRHKRIPVMSRARTIVEVSGRLTAAQTGKVIDELMRKDKRELEEVRACFARLSAGGRRRTRSIRSALAHRLPGYDPGESDLELSALRTIIAAGLPIPVQQHRVVIDGKRYRIDLAYPGLMVAMELVGWDPHSGRESFDDDKARAGDLVASGWRVLEITSRHSPDDVVRRIRGTIAAASREAA